MSAWAFKGRFCAYAIGTKISFAGPYGVGSATFRYSKTCVKRPLKNRQNKELNYNW